MKYCIIWYRSVFVMTHPINSSLVSPGYGNKNFSLDSSNTSSIRVLNQLSNYGHHGPLVTRGSQCKMTGKQMQNRVFSLEDQANSFFKTDKWVAFKVFFFILLYIYIVLSKFYIFMQDTDRWKFIEHYVTRAIHLIPLYWDENVISKGKLPMSFQNNIQQRFCE